MKRSRFLDFTPLIDVLLILLFAILLNFQTESVLKTQAQDNQVNELILEKNKLSMTVSQLTEVLDAETLSQIDDYDKLRFLENHMTFLEVTLRTKHNQVWINNKSYPIILNPNNAPLSESERITYSKNIQTTLLNYIKQHSTSSNIVVVSIGEDGQAYRYAYKLLENALYALSDLSDKQFYFRTLKTNATGGL